jgi:hypothetical protein
MPSFAILDCSVVRFMPSFAAAPPGPPAERYRAVLGKIGSERTVSA